MEQVSHLFADHADLLKEFTYFLPDAVQEQAKERLSRAARESELRRHGLFSDDCMNTVSSTQEERDPGGVKPIVERARRFKTHGTSTTSTCGSNSRVIHQRFAGQRMPKPMVALQCENNTSDARECLEKKHSSISEQNASHTARTSCAPTTALGCGHSSAFHRQFFGRLKNALVCSTKETWPELLRCLDLFSQGLLNRSEMMELVASLMSKSSNLLNEFQRIVSLTCDEECVPIIHGSQLVAGKPYLDVDWSQSRRCTPSYRELPEGSEYVQPPSGMLNGMCVNRRVVSQPNGSEDSHSFKHMRRNQYEEALFKCEDERYEVDMAIDSNHSTIRVLEHVEHELVLCQRHDDKASTQVLHENPLSAVHVSAIVRIYGDHGREVVELMQHKPQSTVQVILHRLRRKDREWRELREVLSHGWRDCLQLNFESSFNHRSFYFKQHEKRLLSPKYLVAQIVRLNEIRLGESSVRGGQKKHGNLNLCIPQCLRYLVTSLDEGSQLLGTPDHLDLKRLLPTLEPDLVDADLVLKINKPIILHEARRIIAWAIDQAGYQSTDYQKIKKLWASINLKCFGIESTSYLRQAETTSV